MLGAIGSGAQLARQARTGVIRPPVIGRDTGREGSIPVEAGICAIACAIGVPGASGGAAAGPCGKPPGCGRSSDGCIATEGMPPLGESGRILKKGTARSIGHRVRQRPGWRTCRQAGPGLGLWMRPARLKVPEGWAGPEAVPLAALPPLGGIRRGRLGFTGAGEADGEVM